MRPGRNYSTGASPIWVRVNPLGTLPQPGQSADGTAQVASQRSLVPTQTSAALLTPIRQQARRQTLGFWRRQSQQSTSTSDLPWLMCVGGVPSRSLSWLPILQASAHQKNQIVQFLRTFRSNRDDLHRMNHLNVTYDLEVGPRIADH